MSFCNLLGWIWQSLYLDHVISNGYAKFPQTIPKGSRDTASFTLFSEFEPRQNLEQSQMSFDNLIDYILSISMCMQNFITIFFTVQEIGPFSLFQNLKPAKLRPMKNVISQSLGLDLISINVYAKVYQNIPPSSRDRSIFTFQNLALGKASTDDICHFAISWARSFQHQIVCKILSKYSKRFNS